ncbi:MAG: hypothetical protein C0411_10315 [Pseudomonas sp.]|nr:hypothetical protein [Pseudomonas sp.]
MRKSVVGMLPFIAKDRQPIMPATTAPWQERRLLAKAACQTPEMSTDMTPSRASFAPTGAVFI